MIRVAAAFITLAVPALAQTNVALPVHTAGRVVAAADGSFSFGWPGIYIEGRFRGTAVRVRFDAPTDHIRLSIDGVEHTVFRAPGMVDTTISGLPDGEHVVRLDKLTETQFGSSRFIEFEAVGGTPLPAKPRPRRIEFIGDSFTVGYGNTAPGQKCTGQQVHDLTDTSQAFGPIAARGLNADYRINAFSGFGVVRNYDGNVRGQSLPTIYPRAIPGNDASPRDDIAWQPHVIVINLGGNDFSTALKPGEPWGSADALKTDYHRRYVTFVTHLAAREPQARFILMGADLYYAEVEKVASDLTASLPGRVTLLHFTGLDLAGCHGHPSLADHRLLAKLVTGQIEKIQGFR
ncbi:SGNH/GDSL hydrolase family protein [Sphingomonas sp. LT1P40]|uniref:SGNH/GDSL hydrolase family protein n=1 Tax=Alteristakelama amylovorans TaxID=3096166 RepID=UPI002FCB5B1B